MWLKIKAWTKGIIAGAMLLYLAFFLYNNSGQSARFWYWFKHEPEKSVLFIEFVAFVSGVIVTLLAITTLRTVKQITAVRSARRTDRLERDVADMKMKASMLQTKPAEPPAGGSGVTVKVDSLGGGSPQ